MESLTPTLAAILAMAIGLAASKMGKKFGWKSGGDDFEQDVLRGQSEFARNLLGELASLRESEDECRKREEQMRREMDERERKHRRENDELRRRVTKLERQLAALMEAEA